MAKKTKIKPIHFSIEKCEIFDRRERIRAGGKSSMEEVYQILKSFPEETQNAITDKRRKSSFGNKNT